MYVDEVCDYTRPFRMICILCMYTYIEYVVILIIYTTIMGYLVIFF